MKLEARPFIMVLALTVLAAPLATEAQQAGKMPRIGVLSLAAPRSAQFFQSFEQRLRELGYADGSNASIEFRTAGGRPEQLPELATDLVRRQVDIIVASGVEATLQAAKQAGTVPIVIVAVDYDPLARGHLISLANPGGLITGVFVRQPELGAKRLELLKQALPRATRIGVFWDSFSAEQLRAVEAIAPSLGLRLQPIELRGSPYDLDAAFRSALDGRVEALMVLTSPAIFRERVRTAELALKHNMPAAFALREWVEVGGFMSYGVNIADIFARAALYVDKILKGAKPGDLPVEQPTKFELVVNLRTAKAVGLTIPQSLLLRADHVIN